jgi:hypothetical protein
MVRWKLPEVAWLLVRETHLDKVRVEARSRTLGRKYRRASEGNGTRILKPLESEVSYSFSCSGDS